MKTRVPSILLRPETPDQLAEAIADALAEKRPLEVVGRGSKRALGHPMRTAATLDMSACAGILLYEPDELVVSVKAGTLLEELEVELLKHRQRLAFEPADWGPLLGAEPGFATIGGIVAANVSGPRRISHGAARDHVLGAKAVSGRGEGFVCGGRVVKNVTGFDLPKLLAGSMGTLAVMHEMTLRVAPYPEDQRTLAIKGLDPAAGIAAMTRALSSACEVSGAAHLPEEIAACSVVPPASIADAALTALRIEGPDVSVEARAQALRRELAGLGEIIELRGHFSTQFWREVRDVIPFVGDDRIVWRLMLPPSGAAAAVAEIAASHPLEAFFDRGGALVWLALEDEPEDGGAGVVRRAAEAAGGRATLFRASAALRAAQPPFHPEPSALAALAERVKRAYDPEDILNPGRM